MGFTNLDRAGKINGADKVTIDGPSTGFGEVQVSEANVQGQGDFVYGINSQIFITSSFAGATVTTADGMCELQSGTDPAGSATVQFRRGLKYRAGQASLVRATALFETPDAGNAQFLGAGTAECGYFIGYFGTNFGILHSETGQREIRKLTVTTGATTGNVTVTLDGDSIVVPVTGGGKTTQTAYQLAQADYSQVGNGGWLASAISSSVYFIAARSNNTSTGSYSVAGSSIVGTFTQTKAGENQTNTFIPSASFNIDRLDGSGETKMVLDPQKGNVFQIAYQYLGFGNSTFSIEDPNTGKLVNFHQIKNANNRTTPVLKNPNLSVLATSANIGGTTSKTLKTVSMASFVEGNTAQLDPKFSRTFSFTGVNSSVNFVPLALLKANRLFKDQSCFGEIDLVRIAASNEVNNKTLEVGLFLNAVITGDVNYKYVNEQNSIASYAALVPTGTGANTIANGASLTPFYTLVVGSASSLTEVLQSLNLVLSTGQELLIAIRTSASIDGRVNINWFEQQ